MFIYICMYICIYIYIYIYMYIYIYIYIYVHIWVDCFCYLLFSYICSVISLSFFILYVDSLTYVFGWSSFSCRIRFCDTLVVIFCKHHHHQRDPLDPRDLTGPLSAMEQSLLIQYEMEIKQKEMERKKKKVKKLEEKQKDEKGKLGVEAEAGGEGELLIEKVGDKGSVHGSVDTEKSSEDDETSSVDISENLKGDNNYTEEEIKEMKHLPLKIVKREINYDILIDKYKNLIDNKISSAFRVNDVDKYHKDKGGDKDKVRLYYFVHKSDPIVIL
jgi:hypothetical protein